MCSVNEEHLRDVSEFSVIDQMINRHRCADSLSRQQ